MLRGWRGAGPRPAGTAGTAGPRRRWRKAGPGPAGGRVAPSRRPHCSAALAEGQGHGCQLPELTEALERTGTELPGLTVRPVTTAGRRDPLAWVARLPQVPRVGCTGLYQLAVRRPPPPAGPLSTRGKPR